MSNKSSRIAETRARRRAIGMRSTETVLHEREIAVLDKMKERFGLASRSDVIRILIARIDPNTISATDAHTMTERVS